MSSVNYIDIGMYIIIYSFLGWITEAVFYAVSKRRFYNKGFLSLPLLLSYGISFTIIILLLPTLDNNHLLKFVFTLLVVSVVESVYNQFLKYVSPRLQLIEERMLLFSGNGKGILYALVFALIYYIVYLVIHPLILALLIMIPTFIKKAVVIITFLIIAIDFLIVYFFVKHGSAKEYMIYQEKGQQSRFAEKLTYTIWERLYKAYPEIKGNKDNETKKGVFAKGLCIDKLVWIFLVSAFLGDIIETLYCGLVGGEWMSRSSVLYGPFSFVWGIGAVVLTMTLQKLADKNDRYVFMAGYLIGGAYEYMCSVFTEIVFGTVFWDYSEMPLNIGGRTNVLYCFFWGILSVVWVKIIYPRMSEIIEKLPAIQGKIITWIVMLFMICNAILTCSAMIRHDERKTDPTPSNAFEEFLDRQYDDEYMEIRWQNMKIAESAQGTDNSEKP